MKPFLFVSIAFGFLTTPASARDVPRFWGLSAHPICQVDFTEFSFPPERGPLVPPEGWEDRGLRPGLLFVQDALCRCLPNRRRHQPDAVRVALQIRPNAGQITMEYGVEQPWSRPVERMMACLGEPTLTVQPMPYVTDIVTPGGPKEEVLTYPLLFELAEGAGRGDR